MRFLAAACLAWLMIVLVQAPDAMAQEAKPAAKTKTGEAKKSDAKKDDAKTGEAKKSDAKKDDAKTG
ncbi:MAG TPA: hypothetical protein DCE39_05295, partial [Planctomycetaceae bacterium]|nr:hypothetical protein [Planctomycetaceae bacterium]